MLPIVSLKDLEVKAEGVLVKSATNDMVRSLEHTNLPAWTYDFQR